MQRQRFSDLLIPVEIAPATVCSEIDPKFVIARPLWSRRTLNS